MKMQISDLIQKLSLKKKGPRNEIIILPDKRAGIEVSGNAFAATRKEERISNFIERFIVVDVNGGIGEFWC